ncbi:hypothetical protein V2J09_022873 [Rumex salicifolius]
MPEFMEKNKQNHGYNREGSMTDTVTWSSMIAGFMQNSMWEQALKTFRDMLSQGIMADKFSLTSIVSVSADCRMLEFGQQIHAMILKTGHSLDVILHSSLVDMYSKCGSLDDANTIFKQAEERNVVMWTSLISGFALHVIGLEDISLPAGSEACHQVLIRWDNRPTEEATWMDCLQFKHQFPNSNLVDKVCLEKDGIDRVGGYIHAEGKQAIHLFELMKDEVVLPNLLTYIAVLTACNHAELVYEGLKYYKEMKEVYKIEPVLQHYTCVVDLFGRAGRLEDIKKFISENGLSHHKLVWNAFLSSCQVHKSAELGMNYSMWFDNVPS